MADVRTTPIELAELTPVLRQAFDYWKSLKRNDIGPSWQEFDLSELPPKILPTAMVVDIKTPMSDNVFRFWGSELTFIHGREMTGRCPYDLDPPEFGRQLLADHTAIVESKAPHAVLYEVLGIKGYTHSHMVLRLPLSQDGAVVSHIVVCADYSDEALNYHRAKGVSFPEMLEC